MRSKNSIKIEIETLENSTWQYLLAKLDDWIFTLNIGIPVNYFNTEDYYEKIE